MLGKVKSYIEKWHMLDREDKVIVGVSGGADSICLVLLLLELQKEIGFEMIAVHVNHGLRGEEADQDQFFVEQFCETQGILCESYFANVELIAKKRKQSTEEAGREVRKEFFAQALQKHHGTKIALAHHQDDSAETFILHLSRGTGLRGLSGISPINGNVIRPLLCVRRKEVEAYMESVGAMYCVDQTNQSDQYTRNRIRNHVIPYLEKEINAKTVEHMNETMDQIRQVQVFLEECTQKAWDTCVCKEEQGYCIDESLYQHQPDVIKSLLLKRAMAEVSGYEKDLESVHVSQLQELFEKQTGRKLDLPYQMEASRTYEGICIYKKETIEGVKSEEIIFDFSQENFEFEYGNQKISCKIKTADDFEKINTEKFNCDIIKGSISFRTRREGDYITIHPDGRTQKLKSYFVNEKIPQKERDQILLVAEGSHVLWVVGYRRSCIYQVNEDTKKVLEIKVYKGEETDGRQN